MKTGVGIIDSDGFRHKLVYAETIRTRPKDPFGERLQEIHQSLLRVIATYQPDSAAVEDVFNSNNVRSALKLAQVRGVALLTIAESGIPCNEYSPNAIKLSVVGFGKAQKEQVQFMVKSLLSLGEKPLGEDAADALAAAICCATKEAVKQKVTS
jgi:crossover junction endodeoxyribonuclease RuvC